MSEILNAGLDLCYSKMFGENDPNDDEAFAIDEETRYTLWMMMAPLLLIAWTYRWIIINYIKALICQRSVIPIIQVDKLLSEEGKLLLAKAIHIIDRTVEKPNVKTIVILIDQSLLTPFIDPVTCHEVAVYFKNITMVKDIRVVSFLRGSVNAAGYILAMSASNILVDYTTKLTMEVTKGMAEVLKEGSRLCMSGPVNLTGREIVEAGLADDIGNIVDYMINNVGAVLVPVEDAEGWDLMGFAT